MKFRRYSRAISVGLLTMILAVAACSTDSGSDAYEGGGGAPKGPFFIALGHVANATQPEAFKILAHAPDVMIDPTSMRFCFSNATKCAAGQGTIVAARVFDAGGRQVFVAQKYVKLSHDLRITLLAKDMSGADLTSGFTIVSTGKQPTPEATASTTSTSTSTATSSMISSTTSTSSSQNTSIDQNAMEISLCYKAPDDFTCQVEVEMTRLTNERRQAAGLGELVYDKQIAFVSRLWSTEQARRMMTSHEWFETGVWTQQYANEFGQPYTALSENVVMGTSSTDASLVAVSLMNTLWNSELYRTNLLNPGITVVGVGIAVDQSGMIYATQNFGNL